VAAIELHAFVLAHFVSLCWRRVSSEWWIGFRIDDGVVDLQVMNEVMEIGSLLQI
jgi:hypothetical protein